MRLRADLGRCTVSRLRSAGIRSRGHLRDVGALAAFHAVRKLYPDERSMPALFSHQGALLDLHWEDEPTAGV